ncbi:MAG: hypothetical protein AB8E15_11355 [Bdellovibrionales bacterium]
MKKKLVLGLAAISLVSCAKEQGVETTYIKPVKLSVESSAKGLSPKDLDLDSPFKVLAYRERVGDAQNLNSFDLNFRLSCPSIDYDKQVVKPYTGKDTNLLELFGWEDIVLTAKNIPCELEIRNDFENQKPSSEVKSVLLNQAGYTKFPISKWDKGVVSKAALHGVDEASIKDTKALKLYCSDGPTRQIDFVISGSLGESVMGLVNEQKKALEPGEYTDCRIVLNDGMLSIVGPIFTVFNKLDITARIKFGKHSQLFENNPVNPFVYLQGRNNSPFYVKFKVYYFITRVETRTMFQNAGYNKVLKGSFQLPELFGATSDINGKKKSVVIELPPFSKIQLPAYGDFEKVMGPSFEFVNFSTLQFTDIKTTSDLSGEFEIYHDETFNSLSHMKQAFSVHTSKKTIKKN